jgi:hypothetical protein
MDTSQLVVEVGYEMEQENDIVSQAVVEIGYEMETTNNVVSQVVVEIGYIRSGRKYNVIHI